MEKKLVREYGCVKCQLQHREGSDPLFGPHLIYQSKHGCRWVPKELIYFSINEELMERKFAAAILEAAIKDVQVRA